MSYPRDKMIALTAKLAELVEDSYEGADPCAINLEGPFINVRKCGSQNPEAICSIDMGYARELIAAGNGRIKLLTFAPELKDADKLIELLLENGVIPSMGHSIASPEEVLRAIDAGARRCTHLYNGLPPLHHRISSITDVVLTHNDIAVELIVDGAHIDPRMVDITARVKPQDHRHQQCNRIREYGRFPLLQERRRACLYPERRHRRNDHDTGNRLGASQELFQYAGQSCRSLLHQQPCAGPRTHHTRRDPPRETRRHHLFRP